MGANKGRSWDEREPREEPGSVRTERRAGISANRGKMRDQRKAREEPR